MLDLAGDLAGPKAPPRAESAQHMREQSARYGQLGYPESRVATVAHKLRAGPDQLLPQRGSPLQGSVNVSYGSILAVQNQ